MSVKRPMTSFDLTHHSVLSSFAPPQLEITNCDFKFLDSRGLNWNMNEDANEEDDSKAAEVLPDWLCRTPKRKRGS
jgi:hypothetical protein